LVATLRATIAPQPSFACLHRAKTKLKRHLHEPPRQRTYQTMLF
jgi:hypothetical protein